MVPSSVWRVVDDGLELQLITRQVDVERRAENSARRDRHRKRRAGVVRGVFENHSGGDVEIGPLRVQRR